jgi:hypothetical protein
MTTTRTTRVHYTLEWKMTDKNKSRLPLCGQGTKKGKEPKQVQAPCGLLIVLYLLIVIGLLFIIIVIVGSMRGANAKSSQLSMSQWGIGVGDGREDRHVGELKERLIPLTVNNLLVALNYLKALLHHIHALIRAMTKIPQNIFKKPELALEEEETPPLWVVREEATARRGEVVQ